LIFGRWFYVLCNGLAQVVVEGQLQDIWQAALEREIVIKDHYTFKLGQGVIPGELSQPIPIVGWTT
jgi:hypothetical protein